MHAVKKASTWLLAAQLACDTRIYIYIYIYIYRRYGTLRVSNTPKLALGRRIGKTVQKFEVRPGHHLKILAYYALQPHFQALQATDGPLGLAGAMASRKLAIAEVDPRAAATSQGQQQRQAFRRQKQAAKAV